MKILVVSDAWYPQINGVVNTILCTIACLKELGHQVIMLTPEIISVKDIKYEIRPKD